MPTNPEPRRLRVLLADDHRLYAESLAHALALDERIEVAGRAEDGSEAIELALQLRPDVILMDVHMPRLDGIAATRRLRREAPGISVVMLSSSSAAEDVELSRQAGAAGYLIKDADAALIVREVMRVTSPNRVALTAPRAA